MFGDALPQSRSERWALLDQFLARWFSPSRHAGVPPAALDAASRRLAVPLPAALREWYQRQGGRSDVWSLQDRFLPPDRFEIADGLLIFCIENQGVVRWGIAVEDLAASDPPVVVSPRDEKTIRHVEHETTSEFALAFAVMKAKWSASVAYHANGPATDQVCRTIRRVLPRLPFPDHHFPVSPTSFHGDDEVIVEIHADTWIWAAARSRAGLERVDALAGAAAIEWSHYESG